VVSMSCVTMLYLVCGVYSAMLHSVQAMELGRIIRVDNFDSESYKELAAGYLTKFGYMTQSKSVQSSSLQSLDRAISKFQEFAGLEQSGKLTQETIQFMQMPRCGVKDIIEEDEDSPRLRLKITRSKRYALQGSRWRVRNLTYKISKYPIKSGLSKREVDETMKKAFEVWEKATDLKFEKKTSGKVHIDIRFERRSHGDDDPFDGEGGTLAHAFFPVFGGDAHFDDDEDWTVDTPRGTSLLMTASHELGHSLGLSHSNVRRSLMAPFYRGYEQDISLDSDDIRGIQALYGDNQSTTTKKNNDDGIAVRTNSVPTPTPRTTTPAAKDFDNKDLCRGNLDTMVTMKNKVTYAFNGNKYWKLTETSVEPGYPRPISEGWKGLPGNLDAAFTWTNGKTYFFKGSQYWRFSEVGRMDRGYPKDFSKGFSGVPENVDGAMVWPVNKKIYFFKGSQYWKFDPDKSPPVDVSYPRPISNWDGIPNNIDSAMQYSNGKTYFFKNGKYYRFDDEKFSLDEDANPPFPRETGFWWFGCQSNSVRLTKQSVDDANDYVIDYPNDGFDDTADVMWNAY